MKFEDEWAAVSVGNRDGHETYKPRLTENTSPPQLLNSFHLARLNALPFYRHNPGTLSQRAKYAH